jgi:hypothetical protein
MLSYILCEDTKIGINEQDISSLLEYFKVSADRFRDCLKNRGKNGNMFFFLLIQNKRAFTLVMYSYPGDFAGTNI